MTTTQQKLHKVKLGEIADITSSKRIFATDYVDSGIPFYRSREVIEKNEGQDISTKLYISNKKYEEIKEKFGVPRQKDLLLTSVGTLGVPYLVKENEVFYFKDGNLIWFRDWNSKEVVPEFIYYLILNPEIQQGLKGIAIGSSQSAFTISAIKDFNILVPDLTSQKQISSIFCTYDDLIENNTRRIKILEQMAQAIYTEWFVKNPKFKNQRERLGNLVKPQYGYTESASTEQIGPKYLRGMDINKTNFIDWSRVPYCKISGEDKEKYLLRNSDILVIRMADPGKIGIVEQEVDAVFASYLIRLEIIDKRISPYYLFYFLNSEEYQNYIQGAAGGTTRKSASAGVVSGIDIVVPPKEILVEFEEKISLLRSELNNLLLQNAILRQTRDLLLPKLVTGEIRV